MQIKPFEQGDVKLCISVFINAYNSPPWNDNWSVEKASEYINELILYPNFVGFVLEEENTVIGCALGHKKTWWNQIQLELEQFFIHPQFQNKGYGKAFLSYIQTYAAENGLEGITLITKENMPCYDFYEKNGIMKIQNVVYMGKRIEAN